MYCQRSAGAIGRRDGGATFGRVMGRTEGKEPMGTDAQIGGEVEQTVPTCEACVKYGWNNALPGEYRGMFRPLWFEEHEIEGNLCILHL